MTDTEKEITKSETNVLTKLSRKFEFSKIKEETIYGVPVVLLIPFAFVLLLGLCMCCCCCCNRNKPKVRYLATEKDD